MMKHSPFPYVKPGPEFCTILPKPVDPEPSTTALADNRVRTVDLLSASPELSWASLVLLEPRSVDQRQGLLCLIAAVET